MTPRDDFRGPLPLGDDDFAKIRSRVLARIERRPSFPIALRLAAAAAIAVIALLLMPHRAPNPETPAIARRPPIATPVAPHERAAEIIAAPETPKPAKPAKLPAPMALASKGAPPPDSDLRIELQTGDPDIRIIWIASR